MNRKTTQPRIKRDGWRQAFAAVLLMGMVGIAVAGPSGIVTWGESEKALEQRKVQLAQLTSERDALKNRVDLLDPNHPDPDYVGQLAKTKLNVMNHDEKLMMLPKP
jgi:cell division protein FtsB